METSHVRNQPILLLEKVDLPCTDFTKRRLTFDDTRVEDPNTLNLDPDPEFWPNLDTDPVLYVINFERKIILNKTIFFK